LAVDNDVLRARIHLESRYDSQTPLGQNLIQKFIERNERLNAVFGRDVAALELRAFPVAVGDEVLNTAERIQRDYFS
jgi:hypothetical protein